MLGGFDCVSEDYVTPVIIWRSSFTFWNPIKLRIDHKYPYSGNLASDIALKAVKTVLREENDKKEIDIKNYAKVEKVIIRNFI